MRTETWVPFRICSVSLRSSELLVRLCFLSSSFPHWLAGLPPTADWYDSWAGPYHCCLWSSVHLLSKSVVLRYYQDSLTNPSLCFAPTCSMNAFIIVKEEMVPWGLWPCLSLSGWIVAFHLLRGSRCLCNCTEVTFHYIWYMHADMP